MSSSRARERVFYKGTLHHLCATNPRKLKQRYVVFGANLSGNPATPESYFIRLYDYKNDTKEEKLVSSLVFSFDDVAGIETGNMDVQKPSRNPFRPIQTITEYYLAVVTSRETLIFQEDHEISLDDLTSRLKREFNYDQSFLLSLTKPKQKRFGVTEKVLLHLFHDRLGLTATNPPRYLFHSLLSEVITCMSEHHLELSIICTSEILQFKTRQSTWICTEINKRLPNPAPQFLNQFNRQERARSPPSDGAEMDGNNYTPNPTHEGSKSEPELITQNSPILSIPPVPPGGDGYEACQQDGGNFCAPTNSVGKVPLLPVPTPASKTPSQTATTNSEILSNNTNESVFDNQLYTLSQNENDSSFQKKDLNSPTFLSHPTVSPNKDNCINGGISDGPKHCSPNRDPFLPTKIKNSNLKMEQTKSPNTKVKSLVLPTHISDTPSPLQTTPVSDTYLSPWTTPPNTPSSPETTSISDTSLLPHTTPISDAPLLPQTTPISNTASSCTTPISDNCGKPIPSPRRRNNKRHCMFERRSSCGETTIKEPCTLSNKEGRVSATTEDIPDHPLATSEDIPNNGNRAIQRKSMKSHSRQIYIWLIRKTLKRQGNIDQRRSCLQHTIPQLTPEERQCVEELRAFTLPIKTVEPRVREILDNSLYFGTDISHTIDRIMKGIVPEPDTLGLSSKVRRKLCCHMYVTTQLSLNGWQDFAGHIGMNAEDVAVLEAFTRQQLLNITTPEVVLQYWQFSYNNHKQVVPCKKENLCYILSTMQRRDLLEIVEPTQT